MADRHGSLNTMDPEELHLSPTQSAGLYKVALSCIDALNTIKTYSTDHETVLFIETVLGEITDLIP